MKHLLLICLAALCLGLAGCENATVMNAVGIANRDYESRGFPFRMVAKSANGGTAITLVMLDLPRGSTKADGHLKKDILSEIEKRETAKQRGTPVVDDVRLLPDGREVWVLQGAEGIAYIVTLRPASSGGTDFAIDGPHMFVKNG